MEETVKEVNDAINDLIDSAMPKEEVKDSGEPQPEKEAVVEEVKDDKNVDLRKDKAEQQIREALEERNRIREEVALMRGQMDILKEALKPKEEQKEDPTEYMSDTEKALYLQNKALEEKLSNVTNTLSQLGQKIVSNENKSREENFFKNNPDIKDRDDAKQTILNYVKNKPAIAKELLSGDIDLQGVYELALLKSGKPIIPKPQDSTSVFGSGKSEPATPRIEDSGEDVFKKAVSVLRDKNSENKQEAIEAGIDEFAKMYLNLSKEQNGGI